MSGLADKLEALRAGGFSEAEVRGYAATRRQALSDAGFRQDEIDTAFGVRRPEMNEAKKAVARANSMLERQIAEQKEQAASLKRGAADIAAGITGDDETPSLWEYLDFGYQRSVTGLIARGKAPEARPPRLPEGKEPGYFGHLATQAGTLAGDIPAMIAGGLAGGPAGVAVAGPPGAAAGAFGGAFALPAMLRRGLMDEYEKGTITSFEEYWERVLAIGVDGLKGFATGAATGHAGKLAKPGLERLAKEVVTMTTVGQALEGEVPKPRDFLDAFILIVGFKGATKAVESGARKLRNLYAETGATPAEVAADARLDPTIAEDLVSKNIAIPRAYRDRVEPPGEPKPGRTAEPDLEPDLTGEGYRPEDAAPLRLIGEPVPPPGGQPQSVVGVAREVARMRREALGDEVAPPENLIEFLRRSGGIRETDTYRGDLRAMDLHLTTRGEKRFLNDKGMELDDARRLAEEAGYLREGAEVRDLLDAIDRTARGDPVYAAGDLARAVEYEAYTRGVDAFERHRSQFESDGEMLSWRRMVRENWEIEREAARDYTELERAAREHLEPEETFRPAGEPLTLKDLEAIDAAIRESDRVQGQRPGDGGGPAPARRDPGESPPRGRQPGNGGEQPREAGGQKAAVGVSEPAGGREGPAGGIAPPPPPPPAGPKQIPGSGEPPQLPPPSDAVATVLSRAVIGHKTPRRWLDFHRLYTDWVNDQHPLSRAFAAMAGKGKGVAPSDNPVTQARLFRGAMGKPEHFLEISPFEFGTFANVGKSFKAIVRPVFEAGDQNNLRALLMAKRALDYQRRGLETGIDLNAARSVVAELARLEPVARELAEYQDHVLNYLQDAGMLSAEMAARFREANRDYVPFFRLTEDQLAGTLTAKGMQARNPFRRVTGSERAIIDPLESIIKNTYALIMAAEQNNVAKTYVDFAARHGSEWAQKSAVKVKPIYVTPGEIAKIIKTYVTVTQRARKTVSETEETRTTGGGGEAGKPVAKVRATAEEALTARGFSAAEASQILDRIAAAEGTGQATIVERTIRRVEKMEVEQELGAVLLDTGFTIFRPARRNANASEIVVWRNGKAELWEVPLEIAEVFKGLNEQQAGTLLKVLATPAKVLRAGAVLAPEFIGRNPVRDQLSAFVNSDAFYLPFVQLGFGVKSLARAKSGAFDRDFSDWLKGGGSLATLISIDRPATQKSLAKLAGETRFMDSARNVVTSPIQLLQAVSEAAEQGTRIGVFRANTPGETRVRPFAPEASARPRTKDEIQAGSLQARESSLDFRRRGAQAQAVNMLVAFWNAGVQGTDKSIRVFKDHPVRSTARVAAAITLPSVLLYLANRDDPRYRDLAQWQKDLFWIIITDDTVYRLPKPFGLGVLFGSGAERATEFILSRDPKAFDELLETFVRGAAPGVVPTAATPVIEQQANRSLFTERPIVPYATERLLPQYQYTLYTTELAKAVGAAVAAIPGMRHSQAASPAILENYVRAWTGGLGIHALKLADASLRAAGVLPDPNLAASTWADIPFVKAFIVREPSMSAKPVNDFFDRYQRQAREMATVKALAKQGDPAAALMELERSGGMFADVDGIKQAISNGIKLTRDIAKDPTMSPDDKRQIIDQVTRQVIEMARAGNALMDATEKAKSK